MQFTISSRVTDRHITVRKSFTLFHQIDTNNNNHRVTHIRNNSNNIKVAFFLYEHRLIFSYTRPDTRRIV